MKVIIAGSRSISDSFIVHTIIDNFDLFDNITEVVSGKCPSGVDKLGEEWAEANDRPVKLFPADWKTYGKGAGYKRNQEMAEYAEALLAIWDGESKGTGHMIDIARREGLLVEVVVL